MPFTISHAAAALPVHVLFRRLPLAALMVGSMAPDFPYFLDINRETFDGHSLSGLFLFSLPAGVAVWLYFVTVLERPTIAFLPDAWRTRFEPTVLTARGIAIAAFAVLLGAITHVIWDRLTHSSLPLVQNTIPGTQDSEIYTFGTHIPVQYILQSMSSGLGLLVLVVWAWLIPRRPPVPAGSIVPALAPTVQSFERFLALLFIGVMACAAPLIAILCYGKLTRSDLLFTLLVGNEAGCFIGWSMLAFAVKYRPRAIQRFTQTRAE